MTTPPPDNSGGNSLNFNTDAAHFHWSINNNQSLYVFNTNFEQKDYEKLGDVINMSYTGSLILEGEAPLTHVFKIGCHTDINEDGDPSVADTYYVLRQDMYQGFQLRFQDRFWKVAWDNFEQKRTTNKLAGNKGQWLTQFWRANSNRWGPKQDSPAVPSLSVGGSRSSGLPSGLNFGSSPSTLKRPPPQEAPSLGLPGTPTTTDDLFYSQGGYDLAPTGAGVFIFIFLGLCVCVCVCK